MESLNPKIAEKNSQIRNIQKESNDIIEQQRRMQAESQQMEDILG